MRDVRRHRLKLYFDACGCCHYCGCVTVFPMQGVKDGTANLATIDHRFSRFHPYRQTPNVENEKRHVLSCFKCNQMRARLEEIVQFLVDETFYIECAVNGITQRKKSVAVTIFGGG